MRIATVLAAALLGATSFAGAEHAQATIRHYQFNIPRQSLDAALKDMAQQTGLQIGRFGGTLDGSAMVGPVKGDQTPEQALKILLEKTGLDYRIVSDTTIAVFSSKDAEPPTTGISGSDSTDLAAQSAPASQNNPVSLEEVVVTGTNIPGVQPISPLVVIDRAEIQRSGYATTSDVIRSVPQNFGGGVNPGMNGTGGESGSNVSDGSSVNLRGLGSESTLTLVDGHRLASDSYLGGIVDISAIPVAAIERIEIVTDGASAIYGSDAVGGVANFILRRDYDGAQTSARVGTATQGGATEYEANQLIGKSWGSGGGLLNYEYYHQNSLLASSRPYSENTPGPFDLQPDQDKNAVFGKIHQDIGGDVSLSAEGLLSYRTSGDVAAFPTYLSIVREHSYVYGLNMGADWRIDSNWDANLTATASHDHTDSNGYLGIPRTAPVLTSPSRAVYNSGLESIEGIVTGRLFDLPSGAVNVALGGGYRSELYYDNTSVAHFWRHVGYGFGEARLPLLPPSEQRIGLERLELSLAGRVERYSDFGTTANPKVGLLYVPQESVALRATWGTSFRAPGLYIEDGMRQFLVYPGALLKGAPAGSQFILLSGANNQLTPEKARTWTAGGDLTPAWLPDFKLSATVFDIAYRDRIVQPVASLPLALLDPNSAPFVTFNPSAALQAQLLENANFYRDNTGGAYNPERVYTVIADEYQNVSILNARGVDLTAAYHRPTAWGDFGLTSTTSWLRETRQPSSAAAVQVLTGTIFNPPRFKARAGLTWSRGGWSSAWFLNHVSSETNAASAVPIQVGSFTTVDAQFAVDASGWSEVTQGTHLSLSIRNLLDRDPPYLNTGFSAASFIRGYDPTNASALGRFISLSVLKDW
jgi:iron complex outermembrane receptor protein